MKNFKNPWLWQNASNSVNAKVYYLCAGILNDKSSFSHGPQLSLQSKINTNKELIRLFSLPSNNPNKWTVPLTLHIQQFHAPWLVYIYILFIMIINAYICFFSVLFLFILRKHYFHLLGLNVLFWIIMVFVKWIEFLQQT